MNINNAFPSNYVKAADLQGKAVNVIMDKCILETVGQKREELPVLYFHGKEKGLVLNKTNGNTITDCYGPETDGWIGKPLQIFCTQTEWGGRMVDCIRVRVPSEPVVVPTVDPGEMPPDYDSELPPEGEEIPF